MSEYVYNKDISYRKYLEGIQGEIRSGNRQLTATISSGSSGIVASVEDMKEFYGAGVDRITDGLGNISEGLDTISYQLNEVTAGLAGINYTLEAGFGATVGALGQVNHSIQELIHVQRTGIQVWAYNQFQIAHEAMRIQQYSDALESLNLAINGHGDNVGYKLAWEFHFEKGRILGGFVENADLELIDDSAAEQAFLDAGRYAGTDHKQPASLAYLYAGRSAYNGGRISTAIEHCNDALGLFQQKPDAWWFRGKCLMNSGDTRAAFADLDKAIELDVGSAVKAASDGDYLKHSSELDLFFENQREKYRIKAEESKTVFEQGIIKMRAQNISYIGKSHTSKAEKRWGKASQLFKRDTLSSLWHFPKKAQKAATSATDALKQNRRNELGDSRRKKRQALEKIQSRISKLEKEKEDDLGVGVLWFVIAILSSLFILFGAPSRCSNIKREWATPINERNLNIVYERLLSLADRGVLNKKQIPKHNNDSGYGWTIEREFGEEIAHKVWGNFPDAPEKPPRVKNAVRNAWLLILFGIPGAVVMSFVLWFIHLANRAGNFDSEIRELRNTASKLKSQIEGLEKQQNAMKSTH